MAGQCFTETQIAEFKEAFSLFDRNGTGTIATTHLGNILRSLGRNPTAAELQDSIREVDPDNNGLLEFPEFVHMIGRSCGSCSDSDDQFLGRFEALDIENSGLVTIAELWQVMDGLGERLTEDEVLEMMRECADEDIFCYDDGGYVSVEALCEAALASFRENLASLERLEPGQAASCAGKSAEVSPMDDINIEVHALSGDVLASLRVNPAVAVQELKRQLEPLIGVPSSRQTLIFSGVTLLGGTLCDGGLRDGAEITLVRQTHVVVKYRKLTEVMMGTC